jgi:hypothetical protein
MEAIVAVREGAGGIELNRMHKCMMENTVSHSLNWENTTEMCGMNAIFDAILFLPQTLSLSTC